MDDAHLNAKVIQLDLANMAASPPHSPSEKVHSPPPMSSLFTDYSVSSHALLQHYQALYFVWPVLGKPVQIIWCAM